MSLYMLDQIRNSPWFRATHFILLIGAVSALTSCATKRPEPLISDRAAGPESQIPWNEQQKWEQTGQLGPLAERVNSR